jgi:prepilin-type processing-associated H-X9-DG protein
MGYVGHPNYPVNSTKLAGMTCPSNSETENWLGGFARANYVGNNGFGPLSEGAKSQENHRVRERRGVFYLNAKMGFKDFRDGSSNTVVISEIVTVPGQDQRGANYPEGMHYHHNYTPNNKTPDWVRTGHCVTTVNEPCVGTFTAWNNRNLIVTSRSNHPGGVNVLMGDGSVTFVGNTIDQLIWESAATPSAILNEKVFSGF